MTKKRGVQEIKMPNDEGFYQAIMQIDHPGVRAYAAFIFLTGARAREVLGMRKPMKDRRKGESIYLVEPLLKSDIEFRDEEGFEMYVNNLPTFKRRDRERRTVVVMPDKAMERKYYDVFKAHYDSIEPHKPLFNFGRKYAWHKIHQATSWHIHFLRSVRATRLAVTYDLDAIALQKFFNWSGLAPAGVYTRKSLKDIVAKMRAAP